jgi:hypothetical protein
LPKKDKLQIKLNHSIKDLSMYHDVTDIRILDDYKLQLTFDNGKSGVLDCKPFIDKGGVFSKLSDPEFFKSVQINCELGVLTWDDKIDIAPETVYSIATGSPLPEWMENREQVA